MLHSSLSFRVLAAVFSASLVSACSGGAGSIAPPIPRASSAGGVAAPSAAPVAPASVTVRVAIPGASPASAARRPAYVSPATNSITIAQAGRPPQTLSLAANSPNCTALAGGGRSCSIVIAAAPGPSRVFTLTIFASTDGSGSPLATSTVVQTIAEGTANSLAVTLNGVVASLALFLENPNLAAGTAGSTLVVLNALDVAGATIVGPGSYVDANGNPVTVTLSDSDTSGATRLGTTSATSSATIPLIYSGAALTGATISATAPSIATVTAPLAIVARGATLSAAAANAVLVSTEQFYATLPHADPVADIAAVAAEMVSSGAYTSATVSPGGISATMTDGAPAFIYADRIEDLTPSYATSASVRARAAAASTTGRRSPLADPPLGGLASHAVVFLVNELDTNSFDSAHEAAFVREFQSAGFGGTQASSVAVADASLENIVTLGTGGLDLLDLSTHGAVRQDSMGNSYYVMRSTTEYTEESAATYASDIAAGRLMRSATLTVDAEHVGIDTLSFTMDFLAKHAKFNDGALFFNNSCYGQNPLHTSATVETLQKAGVGRYFGWTKAVYGLDADSTSAFVYDRLVGEDTAATPILNTLVLPRMPAQRAFPLDDIQGALSLETRNGPLVSDRDTYDTSARNNTTNANYPPEIDGSVARFVVSDLGGENVAAPVAEYGLPSIENVTIAERQNGGTMTLYGRFPDTAGTVRITDAAGPHDVAATTWTQSSVTAPIPNGGAGAAGLVSVITAGGLTSGAVPLTQWSGKFKYSESDSLPTLGGGITGSGYGQLGISFTLDFRADVHPTVTVFDGQPVPQAFAFTNPEGDSVAKIETYDGNFVSGDGKVEADFSAPNPPFLTIAEPPLGPGNFEFRSVPEFEEPTPCNAGVQGPVTGTGSGNILCPIVGFYGDPDTVRCTDTGENSGCPGPDIYDTLGAYGVDSLDAGGLLELTMDPKTYAVSVTSAGTSFMSFKFFSGETNDRLAAAGISGTVTAPLFAPSPLPAASTAPSAANRSATGVTRPFVPMPTTWKVPPVAPAVTAARIGVRRP